MNIDTQRISDVLDLFWSQEDRTATELVRMRPFGFLCRELTALHAARTRAAAQRKALHAGEFAPTTSYERPEEVAEDLRVPVLAALVRAARAGQTDWRVSKLYWSRDGFEAKPLEYRARFAEYLTIQLEAEGFTVAQVFGLDGGVDDLIVTWP